MKNWKLAAELFRIATNSPEQGDLDPAEYEDQQFDDWHKCATGFLAASTNCNKLDFLRKEVEDSILEQFKQGKIYVHSEKAPVEDNFEWIGEIHTTHDDPKFFDLMATIYEEDPHDDDAFVEKRRQPLYEIGIETLCAVADNLFV